MLRYPFVFHLVDCSPWPFFGSISSLITTFGGVLYMHNFVGGGFILFSGICMIIFTMIVWWRDVIREGSFEGFHTESVQVSLRLGMLLFIVSEVMFFFAFFWAFFASSFSPTPALGLIWPPMDIEVLCFYHVPLANTILLLSSGITVTWAHHSFIARNKIEAVIGLALTIFLAISFTLLQIFEYYNASFSINDGVYGSTFYMATGFHGFHVIIGTLFLTVCFFRLLYSHFTSQHHVGFEAAVWYWHSVIIK